MEKSDTWAKIRGRQGREGALWIFGRRTFEVEGTHRTKALRQDTARQFPGTVRLKKQSVNASQGVTQCLAEKNCSECVSCQVQTRGDR